MISIKNITKVYKNKYGEKQVVLENTSFSFKKGIKTSILGHSGSGKTTLLNLLGGLDHDFSGELLFNGKTITDFDKYRRENVSFIFQDFNIINHYNLIDNIIIGITNDVKDKQKVALTLLEKVGLLEHANKLPNQLSGGEMQRVAIARALARDTDVLLLDEPTGNLDDDTTEEIMKLIMEVSENKTVIFITHDKELAEKYSDEIIKVESKEIVVTKLYKKELAEKYSDEIAVTRSYEKEYDANLSVSTQMRNKNFNKRFYKNILAKKINLITSSILIIIMAGLFLLGAGINKGIIHEVDNYIINTYKVDKINLEFGGHPYSGIKPISFKGIQYVIDQENNKNGRNIEGFMVNRTIDTYIGDFDFDDNAILISEDYDFNEEYLEDIYGEDANIMYIDSLSNNAYLLQDNIRENIEKDIVYGRYPETAKEILLSKGNAVRTIAKYKCNLEISEKEKQKCLDEILNFSDEELFNEIKKLEITYIVKSLEDESSFEIVGLIDDYKYIDHYELYKYYSWYRYKIFKQNFLIGTSMDDSEMNNNIYFLEDGFAYIHGGQAEYERSKSSKYSIFIKEENPKLRQRVISSIVEDNKHLFRGDDLVVSEYEKYHEFYKNYRLGILGVSILLALFGCIVIYNSIKTIILRSKKNIGIFKSLGYTSKNIRSMFVKEGIIISLTIILMSLIVWSGMRFFVNDTVALFLDSTEKLGFSNITRLSLNSVIILFLVINLFVISPIIRILNVKNVIKILR